MNSHVEIEMYIHPLLLMVGLLSTKERMGNEWNVRYGVNLFKYHSTRPSHSNATLSAEILDFKLMPKNRSFGRIIFQMTA